MSSSFSYFATAPKGLELLLVEELRALGAMNPAEKLAGVTFQGDLTVGYKACLWSRLANRILLFIGQQPAATPEALYQAIQTIAWDQHFDPDMTFAITCVTVQSRITHRLFAAQKIKDAIVDQFRERYGCRPDVARSQPDVAIYVYLYRDHAHIYLDLSGDSLHKRGYRLTSGAAPLKENLAAAILIRAGWPALAEAKADLLDPMCGSGTLLIEAAQMADRIAPGLQRSYFGFLRWKQHQSILWEKLRAEALAAQRQTTNAIKIIGYDHDAEAIKIAFENIERAGMRGRIHVEKRALHAFVKPTSSTHGLVVTNPPYGERLGEIESLRPLYNELGAQLKQSFLGWQAAVLTGNPELGKQMGLRAKRYYALWNGTIACQLLLFDVEKEYFVDRSPAAENERLIRYARRMVQDRDQTNINMFINRLQKKLKHLRRQAVRQPSKHYCIYDADLPEYAFRIEMAEEQVHIHEYPPSPKASTQKMMLHRYEVLACLPDVLQVALQAIYFFPATSLT